MQLNQNAADCVGTALPATASLRDARFDGASKIGLDFLVTRLNKVARAELPISKS